MRRRNILALLLALTLLLPGCGGARTGGGEEARLTILASTYPVYLAARAVTDGVDGVAVERLNTGEVSCLHDYTLTVTDMKKIETADIIALNGADLEEFMEDALAASSALVIDCSEGVSLLENADHVHTEGDDGHDHGHYDPHYWMDPDNMAQVVENLYAGLNQADDRCQQLRRYGAGDFVHGSGGERGGALRPGHLPRRLPLLRQLPGCAPAGLHRGGGGQRGQRQGDQ